MSTTLEGTTGAQLAAANRTRAVAAGLDPNQYEHLTHSLERASDWTPTLLATASEHRGLGDRAAAARHRVSAAEAYLRAALWAHFATTWPNPDRAAHAEAVASSAQAYRAALAQLEPTTSWIDERDSAVPFTGVLRRPTGVTHPPLALIVCGLDSGKEEFHHIADALLARGVATFAFDGPGQGELSPDTTIEPRYERVITRVLNVLTEHHGIEDIDHSRVGAIALSLGGYYGLAAAAAEPRLRTLVTVSGVCSLRWQELPEVVTNTLTQRCGGEPAARAFADTVHAKNTAPSVQQPLLVVAGGQDIIPSPAQATQVAHTARHGELLLVDDADHLLASHQWHWLGQASDWLADQLTNQPDPDHQP